jgi:subtilisin family serine protease
MQLQDFISLQLAILLIGCHTSMRPPRLPEPAMALNCFMQLFCTLIGVHVTCAREDFIGDFSATSAQQDCDGHGTHISSIAVGRSVGVAKEANIVGVRVLDCNGTGQSGTLLTQGSPLLLGCNVKFA